MKAAPRRSDTDRGDRRHRRPNDSRVERRVGGVSQLRPSREIHREEVGTAVTAWEIALAGVSFALIGALLALRIVEAFSGDERTGEPAGDEFAGPTPSARPEDPADAPEPIPDEDRVVELLSAQGGSLRQQAVVDRTDWSKSKVSRLLSRMEERGTIRKVPVGRENAIELAGEESTGESEGDDG